MRTSRPHSTLRVTTRSRPGSPNSHHQWVGTEGMHFTSSMNATGHHNVVKFNWEMIPANGGAPTSIGFDFLILADDGRTDLDYQFIE